MSGVSYAPFQHIRFTLYKLEQDIIFEVTRCEKSKRFFNALYALLDASFVKNNQYRQTAERFIAGGASVLQLRMKNARAGEILPIARDIAALCQEKDVLFIINVFS